MVIVPAPAGHAPRSIRIIASSQIRSSHCKSLIYLNQHPIDYVDLGDLGVIIRGKQNDFIPKIIPDIDWFSHLMRELEPSRNVVCHMNPLDDDNTGDVKSWFRKWEKTLANGLADGAIPKAPG